MPHKIDTRILHGGYGAGALDATLQPVEMPRDGKTRVYQITFSPNCTDRAS